MVKEKIEILKSYFKTRILRYFSSVRGTVLLIVIPVVFIVPFYFLTVVKEIVIDKRSGMGTAYEERFAAVRNDLPANKPFNYISDQRFNPDDGGSDWFYARYALIPARLVEGLEPPHDLLVVEYLNTPGIPRFRGYKLLKNYDNGVMLFKRSAD
jgi:hypothetical protein